MKRFKHYFLWLLIGLGIGFRIYQFGANPISLNRDEAALGYNAYTMAHYGVDEWGKRLPLLFVSFGDYKLPGYIYALVPFIWLFGPQDWVIRLPSLLAGFVLIYLAYAIIDRVTKSQEVALCGAAVSALLPWSIFYARTAFEAHLGLMWLVMTGYLLLLPFKRKRLVLAALTYLLAVLTYNTPLLLAPGLIILLLLLPGWKWPEKISQTIVLGIVALVVGLGLLPLMAQKQNITIFADPTIQTQIREGYAPARTLSQKLMAHWITQETWLVAKNTILSLGPKFLVFKGGAHPWHSVPGWGHMYIGVYIFAGMGILLVWRRYWPLVVLMMLALIPAVITVDAPHATRSLLFFFLMGLTSVIPLTKWPKLIPIFLLGLLMEAGVYGYRYFWLFPSEMPGSWPTGIETAIIQGEKLRRPDQLVAVTNAPQVKEDILSVQVYIYALLYSQSRPSLRFDDQLLDGAGLVRVGTVGHYQFVNSAAEFIPGSLVIERQANGFFSLNN